jgi:AcrR family transcriptional regulator
VTNGHPDATPRRGRPRNDAIDEAAVEAALDLLVEGGVRAVTVDAVARRAGTTPPAIYRRWPNAEDLLWSAMGRMALAAAKRTHGRPPYSPDGLPFDMALRQTMRRCAEIYGDQRLAASYLAVSTAARVDPEIKAGFTRFQQASRDPLLGIVQTAADAAGVPAGLLVDMVVGVVIYRIAIKGTPPAPEEIDAMADLVTAGCRALAQERGQSPP